MARRSVSGTECRYSLGLGQEDYNEKKKTTSVCAGFMFASAKPCVTGNKLVLFQMHEMI